MSKKTASAIMLSLLAISTLTFAFKIQIVKANDDTIYIRIDGSIDPPTAPISTVDNITYTFTGDIINVSIVIERDNITVDGAGYMVQGTNASTYKGIYLEGRSNVTIRNIRIDAFDYGIFLESCSGCTLNGNNVTNNGVGIFLNLSYDNNRVSGNSITNNGRGVYLEYNSFNDIVSGNNITNNKIGILLDDSYENSVSGNNITYNEEGIYLEIALYNSFSENNIAHNGEGVYFSPNIVWPESISISQLSDSNPECRCNACFYRNNFVNNTSQVDSNNWTIVWNEGYPLGGNYWSDYNGIDQYYGSGQNKTGSDGIGDTPYVIDICNIDHYPFANPLVIPSAKLIGDLNLDGKVNHSDVTLLSYSYSSKSGDPNWNPNADLAPPYGIISLTDLVTLAIHYRQHSP